ncbi:DUF4199 domain-containing protein [Halpernia sp.]|uniref:DUF4199 domain-containing protein n=1 Tax=Halpernia sp. TaxID=2782209 RepID=UPI003A906615
MKQNSVVKGLILFILTMIIFFVVYYFYNGLHYFETTMMMNSFALPVLYALVAFFSVRQIWKKEHTISFKVAFKNSFLPMFIGSILSLFAIFSFLNFVDPAAKDILNYQFTQTNKNELQQVYNKEKARLKTQKEIDDLNKDFNESMQSFSKEQLKGKDVFTLKYFSYYFGAIFLFDAVFSFFMASFFRSRSPK